MNLLDSNPIRLRPLCHSFLADTETPLSIYLKLAEGEPNSYLFESVVGGERWGRYSIIGLAASECLKVFSDTLEYWSGEKLLARKTGLNPLDEVKKIHQRFHVEKNPDLPAFSGGLVGYFGYEIVKLIEPKLAERPEKTDVLQTPDSILSLSTDVIIVNNLNSMLYLITHYEVGDEGSQSLAEDKLSLWKSKLKQTYRLPLIHNTKERNNSRQIFHDFSQASYQQAVEQIKEYIVNGDLMQVSLSQRVRIPFEHPPIHLYRAIRHINPSPYMFLMDYQDFQIIGASPEILVRMEGKEVTVRPIAGTRERGENPAHDLELEHDLLSDAKELSEHLMLIDLARNDIGRLCDIGTVKVTDQMFVERYAHVMHIVSNVKGRLPEGTHPVDVLKAVFPAGTISGAPKIRAMEIIDDLEKSKRSVYSGTVGYIGWNNNMDTAIAIRTAVVKDKNLYVQAGAGIVADSVAEKEWAETMSKMKSILKAVDFVDANFGA